VLVPLWLAVGEFGEDELELLVRIVLDRRKLLEDFGASLFDQPLE
jgi:hypothetical protein